MKYFRLLYSDIHKNILYYYMAFALVSSAIAFIPYGQVIYASGIVIHFYFTLLDRNKRTRGLLFCAFMLACVFSCFINSVFDYRLFLFILILYVFTPICESRRLYAFRAKYIYYSLMSFPLLSLAALFCYYMGINYFDNSDFDNPRDFSAFFPHPLWLGAAVGIANVIIVYLIYKSKTYFIRILLIVVLFQSILITVIAASRVALLSSVIAMLIFVHMKTKNIKSIVKFYFILILSVTISIPFYMSKAGRIIEKNEYGQDSKYGSRTELFENGISHLRESPLFGYGYAVSYNGLKRHIGRIESGSGWLSVLFQTGFFGAAIMLLLMIKVIQRVKLALHDDRNIIFFAVFCFICLHSCFEGYILTSGYYLCILFWTLLSHFYSYSHFYPAK